MARTGVGDLGFLNALGEEIAADYEQLLSGNHTAPILTQTGQLIVGGPVWTGANPDGTWSGYTAQNWSDPYTSSATVGIVNGGSGWLSSYLLSANQVARLYCISE